MENSAICVGEIPLGPMGLDIAFQSCLAKEFLRSSNLAREKGSFGGDTGSNALPLGLCLLVLQMLQSLRGSRAPLLCQPSLGPERGLAVPVPWVDSLLLVLLT